MDKVDYKKAFESLMSEQGGPGVVREIYEMCGDYNLRKAIKEWWNARYRKPLK